MTQAVGDAAVRGEQLPVEGPTASAGPVLPPLPEWTKQWLPPATVHSIEEWGAWANSATKAGKDAVADAANATARSVPEAARQVTTHSTTMSGDAAAQSSKVVDAPWLADVVGWLVPIVWVIWGVGVILGLLVTLIAQWGVSRFIATHP